MEQQTQARGNVMRQVRGKQRRPEEAEEDRHRTWLPEAEGKAAPARSPPRPEKTNSCEVRSLGCRDVGEHV